MVQIHRGCEITYLHNKSSYKSFVDWLSLCSLTVELERRILSHNLKHPQRFSFCRTSFHIFVTSQVTDASWWQYRLRQTGRLTGKSFHTSRTQQTVSRSILPRFLFLVVVFTRILEKFTKEKRNNEFGNKSFYTSRWEVEASDSKFQL